MIIIALIGTSISLLKPKLLWIFLIYGAMGPAILFPAIFSVYSKKLTAKRFTTSVLLSFIVATPISIYANVTENSTLIVFSSIIAVLIGLLFCSFTLIKK